MDTIEPELFEVPRIVYRLFNPDSTDFYIGSTADDLRNRLCKHKYMAKVGCPSSVYDCMRKLGINNWKAEVLATFICSKDEIRKKEQDFIETFKPSLNSIKAFSSRDENLKLRSEVTRLNRLLGNKLNKARLGREKEECACGSTVQKSRMARHLTTTLHFRRLLKRQDEQPGDKQEAPEIQVEISSESGKDESRDVHSATSKSEIPTVFEAMRRDSPKMEVNPGQP